MGKEIKDIISFDKIVNMAIGVNEIDGIDLSRLTVVYKLPKDVHYKLDEDLYYRGENRDGFKHSDIIEVEIGGVLFKFISDDDKLILDK